MHLIPQPFLLEENFAPRTSTPNPFSLRRRGGLYYRNMGQFWNLGTNKYKIAEKMIYKKKNLQFLLHLESEQKMFRFAKNLRKRNTNAEKLLWEQLKERKFYGLKFRRQHPILYYVADFYCHEERLIVEIDGEVHNTDRQKEHDKNRSAELGKIGIRVLRLTNNEVELSIDEVIKRIKEFVFKTTY